MDKALWKKDPEDHDFEAAYEYLTLLFDADDAKKLVGKLKDSKTIIRKAKDILRASKLSELPKSNIHVKENLVKIAQGEKLSPILLVSNKDGLIIADGYHRVCTIYYKSEDLEIPCRLI